MPLAEQKLLFIKSSHDPISYYGEMIEVELEEDHLFSFVYEEDEYGREHPLGDYVAECKKAKARGILSVIRQVLRKRGRAVLV